MKTLKIIGLAALSLLLFISLIVFGIAFMLRSTVLNPDFMAAQVKQLELAPLVSPLIEKQLQGQLPPEAQFAVGIVAGVVEELEPELKEQVDGIIHEGYDYFLGKSERLEIVIELESLKERLREAFRASITDGEIEVLRDYLPPEIAAQLDNAPPELIEQFADQYFDGYYEQFAGQIPSQIVVDEDMVPPEAMEQMAQVRSGIRFFQAAFFWMLALLLVLVISIVLVGWRVRWFALPLGITFFLYGVLQYGAVLFSKSALPRYVALPPDVPPQLQDWALRVAADMMAPLGYFSLGFLIAGIALIVVGIVVKPPDTDLD